MAIFILEISANSIRIDPGEMDTGRPRNAVLTLPASPGACKVRRPISGCRHCNCSLSGRTAPANRRRRCGLVGLNPGVLEGVRRSRLADKLGSGRLLYNAWTANERFLAEEEQTGGTPGQPSGRVAMHKRRGRPRRIRHAATARTDQPNPTT